MQILSAIATKATVQKKRNLFGLGLTSLIAACGTDEAAGTAGTSGGVITNEGDQRTPAGPIGDIPANPAPAKLSATLGQLAEVSIEKLPPVADIDSNQISASAPDSDTRSGLKDLVVTIDKASGLVTNDFAMTFKNGNHDSDPLSTSTFVSVHQLTGADKHDLVVTSADFGNPDGSNKTGAIYIVWDIGSRTTTTFDDTTANNFLRIEGVPDTSIGKHAPNFFHIGGNDAQYDMTLGADDSDGSSHIYIVWNVTQHAGANAGADNKVFNLFSSPNPIKTTLTSRTKENINRYLPEFFHIGGVDVNDDPQYDMVIRGDGEGTTRDIIYIVWDVANFTSRIITLGGANADYTVLAIKARDSSDRIVKYAPELLQIGGAVDAGHDMVIRSDNIEGDGGRIKGGIFILWDVAEYNDKGTTIITLGQSSNPQHGLLRIFGEAEEKKIGKYALDFVQLGGVGGAPQQDMVIRSDDGTGIIYVLWDVAEYYNSATVTAIVTIDLNLYNATKNGLLTITGAADENIGKHSSEFLQIGGAVDASNSDAPQQDMIIRSDAAIYVLWDVAAYYDDITIGGGVSSTVTLDLGSDSIKNGLLKIGATGENIGKHSPEFFKLAGIPDQDDMIIRSEGGEGAIYVLWDVASYYDPDNLTAPVAIDLSDIGSANHGLLKITGSTATGNIGQNAPDTLKINNNNDYDMIIKSDTAMYVLWDFAKYGIVEGSPANVDINLTDTANANGLLTISGGGTADVLKNDDGSFTDIDGKGINDLVFKDGGNTFILFGEQLAYRDVDGKAVSHTVDLAGIKGLDFGGSAGFFTADAVTTVAADAIGYRFADDDHKTLQDVQDNPPSFSLSDADADLGAWDIA